MYITANDLFLSDSQKRKINSAFKNKKPCSIRISYKKGNSKLNLTQTQYYQILEGRKKKKYVEIVLTSSQLTQNGGFLPFLAGAVAAAAPFIAKALAGSAISSGVNAIVKKVKGKGMKGKGYIIPGTERVRRK